MIELIHGQPGEPQDWISVVGVAYAFDQLLAEKRAQPAVLVMPDVNGGRGDPAGIMPEPGRPAHRT